MSIPMRMKKKLMNKMPFTLSGSKLTEDTLTIDVVAAASDAASKGVSAQPTLQSGAATAEQGTGEPLERVNPAQAQAEAQAEVVSLVQAETVEAVEATEVVRTEPKADEPTEAKLVVTTEGMKDPNAQKEATTVAPNTGPGTVVAMTEELPVTTTET